MDNLGVDRNTPNDILLKNTKVAFQINNYGASY